MKKTTLALAVAIASLSSVAYAAQPDNTFYVGAKAGWSGFHDVTYYNQASDGFDITKNRVGGGLFLGYQANPYMAIELGYDWLGQMDYKDQTGSRVGKLTVSGASLTGKLSYPLSFINDDLDIYARAGAFIHSTRWKGADDSNDTSVSPVGAIGFDYKVNEQFSTRLDYQWVNNIDNSGPARPDNSLLTFGVSYNFGWPGTTDATAVAILEFQENRYVLNDDILFDYAKATLKPDGKAALNELLSVLVQLNPSKGAIVVIGHTDRIGSNQYNLKLSEQRAASVVNYLVAQGVPSNIISARGVGKANPVTGNKCDALKGADLKACLAPDRRVEIEIKALNVEEVEVIAVTK